MRFETFCLRLFYSMLRCEKTNLHFSKILEQLSVLCIVTVHSCATDKKTSEFVMSINGALMNDMITELKSHLVSSIKIRIKCVENEQLKHIFMFTLSFVSVMI